MREREKEGHRQWGRASERECEKEKADRERLENDKWTATHSEGKDRWLWCMNQSVTVRPVKHILFSFPASFPLFCRSTDCWKECKNVIHFPLMSGGGGVYSSYKGNVLMVDVNTYSSKQNHKMWYSTCQLDEGGASLGILPLVIGCPASHAWSFFHKLKQKKKSLNCCGFGFICWRGSVVRCYHQLMIEWLADVLKGSQSTVGTVTAAEANPGIPEGRYSNPADNQNRSFWCCLRIHMEKLVQTFPSRNRAIGAHHFDGLQHTVRMHGLWVHFMGALGELLIRLSIGKAGSWR